MAVLESSVFRAMRGVRHRGVATLVVGISFLCPGAARAQESTLRTRTFDYLREAVAVVATADGNVALAGSTLDGGSSLLLLSPGGDLLSETPALLPDGTAVRISDLAAAPGGGVAAVGTATGAGVILALGPDGTVEWATTLPGFEVGVALHAIANFGSAGYLVAGHTTDAYGRDGVVARLDLAGEVVWSTNVRLPEVEAELIRDVAFLSDGRVVTAGTRADIMHGEPWLPASPFVAFLDADDGDVEMGGVQDTLSRAHLSWLYNGGLRVTSLGNAYALMGFDLDQYGAEERPIEFPTYLARFDERGEVMWRKTLQLASSDDSSDTRATLGNAMVVGPSNHILITGEVRIAGENGRREQGFVARLDAAGHLQEVERWGTPETTVRFRDLAILSDGRLLLAGSLDSMLYVVSTSFPVGLGRTTIPTGATLEIGPNYPDPFINETTLPVRTRGPGIVDVEICDVLGRIVHRVRRGFPSGGLHQITLQARLAPGLYFAWMRVGGRMAVEPLVVVR